MIRKYFILIYLCLALVGNAQGQVPNKPDSWTVPSYSYPLTPYSLPNYGALSSGNLNYTRSYAPLTRLGDINSGTVLNKVKVNTVYTNGWGQPIEIIKRGTLGIGDMVTPVDQRASLNRYSFLPFETSIGRTFIDDPFNDQKNYYNSTPDVMEAGYTFSLNETIVSNGSIINKSALPGVSFAGKGRGSTVVNWFNQSSDGDIYKMSLVADFPHVDGAYALGEITVKDIVGQHGQSREYYNKNNRLVAKKVNDGTNWLTTYYVYNTIGKLAWIIPPMAMATCTGNGWTLAAPNSDICYRYVYNDYEQIIRTHIPDQLADNYCVYDQKHRLVLQQTPLLYQQGKWAFNVYDNSDRVVFSGIVTSSNDYNAWGTAFYSNPSSGTLMYYLVHGFNSSYPAYNALSGCEINKYYYYDDYNTLPAPLHGVSPITSYTDMATTANAEPYRPISDWAYGKLTGTCTRVLDAANPNQWVSKVYFYDDHDRPAQVQVLNPWNTTGWDIEAMQYSFTGKLLMDIKSHNAFSGCNKPFTVVKTRYTYSDFTDNLLKTEQKLDGEGWRELASYTYGKRGQLVQKVIGAVEKQAYKYNIRGQLTAVNDDYVKADASNSMVNFGENLYYDYGFTNKRYDGSIAGYVWRGSGTSKPRSYGYNYDYAGRMTSADFTERSDHYTTNSTWYVNSAVDYSVSNISYDANGNMQAMKQRAPSGSGSVDLDNMTYHYLPNSNKLADVSDPAAYHIPGNDFIDGNTSGNDYDYDFDGNLKQDLNKGISAITYNHMDLPLSVTAGTNTINNIYDADGNLWQKTVYEGGTTTTYRYCGPFNYKNNDLDFIAHEEGRSRYISTDKFSSDFYVKDHLGNVRAVVNASIVDIGSNPHNGEGTIPIDDGNGGGSGPIGPVFPSTFGVISSRINDLSNTLTNVSLDNAPGNVPDGNDPMDMVEGDDPDKRIGSAILLHGISGNPLSVKAYGYYETSEAGDMSTYTADEDMRNALITALQNGSAGFNSGQPNAIPAISTSAVADLLSSGNYSQYTGLRDAATDPAYPRMYMNCLVFDENMNLQPSSSQVVQFRGEANNWASMEAFGAQGDINGYTLMYVSNESSGKSHITNLHPTGIQTNINDQQANLTDFISNPGSFDPPPVENPVDPTGPLVGTPGTNADYHLGFEVLSANVEASLFTQVDEMRENSPQGSPGNTQSGLLEGSDPAKRIGGAILLHGMAGDALNFKAYGYYEEADLPSMNTYAPAEDMLGSLISTLQGGHNGISVGGETGNTYSMNTDVVAQLLTPTNYSLYEDMKDAATDPAYPRAYLNALVFDEQMNLIPGQSSVVQLKGAPDTWNAMFGDAINMTLNGYVLVFLSNASAGKVHMDNEHLYNTVGNLVQEQHYYPHGLHVDNGQNTSVLANKYLYQGKKLQTELGLELYDFHARQYDAQIGRFWGIDPMDQFPSGYTGMGNDPANSIDPTGMSTNVATSIPMYSELESVPSDAVDPYAPHGRNGGGGVGSVAEVWKRDDKGNLVFAGMDESGTGEAGVTNPQSEGDDSHSSKNSSSDNSTPSVTIYIFDAAENNSFENGLGHTAIKIGDVVYGYYPADGDYLYTDGVMKAQDDKEFSNDHEGQKVHAFELNLTTGQTINLQKIVASYVNNPGHYSIVGQQCTSIVAASMINAGITIRLGNEALPPDMRNGGNLSPNQFRDRLNLPINSNLIRNKYDITIQPR